MTHQPSSLPGRALRSRPAVMALAGATLCLAAAGCTPTIRLEVQPIQIYAQLDHNVRISLDRELEQLLRENPNLF